MLELAIIILNYGTPNLVKDCLESLEGQIDPTMIKVLVVDNASVDDSVSIIEEFIKDKSWCALVKSKKNLGFAGGNNLGIKSIEAKNYLLLNSDTIAKKDAIKNLIDFANDNINLGIISCHLQGPNGERHTNKFRFHTPLGEFVSETHIGFFVRILKNRQVPIMDDQSSAAQWVCFAAVLIRKSVFDKIGLLDEKYFLYYEDVDFCKRASEANIGIDVCINAQIVHFISGTTSVYNTEVKRLKRRPAFYYQARNRYYSKHFHGFLGTFSANFFWSLGRIVRILLKLNKNKNILTYQNEWSDIWIDWSKAI